jgi:hypothetical protein
VINAFGFYQKMSFTSFTTAPVLRDVWLLLLLLLWLWL